ncbi:MAG TPA: prolipoprotein diacylglyceryl transferase family protein, partial [Dehalococcoidia bacterium]
IGDLAILGLIWLLWRRNPKSGVIFCAAFILYGIMRFAVDFTRLHNGEVGAEHVAPLGLDLSMSQFISIVSVPLFALVGVYFLRRKEPARGTYVAPKRQTLSRAERRRRLRAGTGTGA